MEDFERVVTKEAAFKKDIILQKIGPPSSRQLKVNDQGGEIWRYDNFVLDPVTGTAFRYAYIYFFVPLEFQGPISSVRFQH